MNAPAHTPGPWTHYEHSTANIRIVGTTLTNAQQHAVAHLCPTGRAELDLANARLIAAAPDLLAALNDAVRQLDFIAAALAQKHTVSISSVQNCAALARNAIARATK